MRALVLLLCILALPAAEVVVRLRGDCTVAAPRATLAEVAEIAGPEADRAALAPLIVAELPTLTPVALDARLVTALAAPAVGAGRLHVAGVGTVRRQARTFAVDALAAAAAATVPGARTAVVRAGAAISVPDAPDLALLAEPLDPQAVVGDVAFRVRALEGGRETGRSLVVLRVERDAAIVVAARDIARGEVLAAGDLRQEARIASRANLPAAVDPLVLIGCQARRDLKAGEPIAPALVAAVPAVRAGSRVVAVWPGRGFSVELDATALADARAGERLGLRRLGDGVLLNGVAQADGTVLVVR